MDRLNRSKFVLRKVKLRYNAYAVRIAAIVTQLLVEFPSRVAPQAVAGDASVPLSWARYATAPR
jgi:hypothetical protein